MKLRLSITASVLVFAFTQIEAHAAKFEVAHVREQGQDMIIFPMNSNLDYKSDQSRREIMFALQRCASSARLGGTVAIVWESNSQTKFMAPRQWHPFFKSIDMLWVAKRLNKTLTCY